MWAYLARCSDDLAVANGEIPVVVAVRAVAEGVGAQHVEVETAAQGDAGFRVIGVGFAVVDHHLESRRLVPGDLPTELLHRPPHCCDGTVGDVVEGLVGVVGDVGIEEAASDLLVGRRGFGDIGGDGVGRDWGCAVIAIGEHQSADDDRHDSCGGDRDDRPAVTAIGLRRGGFGGGEGHG